MIAALMSLALAAPHAPQAAADPPRLTRMPSAYERALAYPRLAADRQVDGSAVLRCRVSSIGTAADCTVLSETPAGHGFGKAAMSLRSRLRFTPPAAGQDPWVEIPLNFEGDRRKALREGAPNR